MASAPAVITRRTTAAVCGLLSFEKGHPAAAVAAEAPPDVVVDDTFTSPPQHTIGIIDATVAAVKTVTSVAAAAMAPSHHVTPRPPRTAKDVLRSAVSIETPTAGDVEGEMPLSALLGET
jgi:hypothetical protein